MTKVSEIMTGRPALVGRDAPVADVAKTMEADDLGAVIVCDENGHPCGVVTDRDLAVEVIGAGRDPSRTTAGDLLLGTKVSTVDQADSIEEAVKVMKERAVRRLPVMAGDQVVGVVSQADIARVDQRLAGELLEVISFARDNTARG